MRSTAEVGTVVGPNAFQELLVAKPCTHQVDDANERRDFWTSTTEDRDFVLAKDETGAYVNSPRSITEFHMRGER